MFRFTVIWASVKWVGEHRNKNYFGYFWDFIRVRGIDLQPPQPKIYPLHLSLSINYVPPELVATAAMIALLKGIAIGKSAEFSQP